MNLADTITILRSLQYSSADFAKADPEEGLWRDDVKALGNTIAILTVLRDAKIETARELKKSLMSIKNNRRFGKCKKIYVISLNKKKP